MKLLIASDCFLPRWDGISRFLYELLPSLKNHFELTVIAPEFKGRGPKLPKVKLIRIKTYNFQIGDYSPPKIRSRLIYEEIKKNDIIFIQTLGPIGAVAARHAAKLNKKLVSYIHSFEWELFSNSITENKTVRKSVHHITKHFVKRIYNKADLLILPSRRTGTTIKRIGITTPTRIVPLGVDTKLFSPPLSRLTAKKEIGIKQPYLIGYAGRIGREKDISTLIKAYKEIRKTRTDIGCVIIGTGIPIYDDAIKEAGIRRFGKTNTIEKYLKAMDIYVLPSLTETSSLSTMEAMGCGAVPIVTGVGETKNYVKSGKTGYKFQVGNHLSLAKKIMDAIDKGNLRKISVNARKEIVKRYDWSKTEKGLVGALKKAAQKKLLKISHRDF